MKNESSENINKERSILHNFRFMRHDETTWIFFSILLIWGVAGASIVVLITYIGDK